MTADPAVSELLATELLAAYRAGELSPVEATEAALQRIRRHDPEVNAFCLVDADAALATAEGVRGALADRRAGGRARRRTDLDQGHPAHPRLAHAAWLTHRGLGRAVGGRRAARSRGCASTAPCCSARPPRRSSAGRASRTTRSPASPATRGTPRARRAARPAAARPPSCSGWGRSASAPTAAAPCASPPRSPAPPRSSPPTGASPHYPASPFGPLAHVGPMTRTAADAALLLDVVSGADPRDPWALAPTGGAVAALDARRGRPADRGQPHARVRRRAPRGRGGVRGGGAGVHRARRAGSRRPTPASTDPIAEFETLWFSGAAKSIEHLGPDERALMDPALVTISEQGARASALDYLTATAVRNDLGILMGEFHDPLRPAAHTHASDPGLRGGGRGAGRLAAESAGRPGRPSRTRST